MEMSSCTGSIGDFPALLSPMHIAAPLACQVLNPEQVHPPKSRSLTKRLDAYMNGYEMGFERVARVRKTVFANPSRLHAFDQTLVYPEQYKSRGIRALIHLSKHLEELAESCADISGLAERLTRNLISSGEKADIALVIASAIGRVISGQLNFAGMAVHKVAGSSLYCLSSLTSLAAVGLSKTKYGSLRSAADIEKARRNSGFDSSGYLLIARQLLTAKEYMLRKVLEKTGKSNSRASAAIHKWVKFMSRNPSSAPEHRVLLRRANCNYMWNNLHQYGPVTRALMHVAYGMFQGVNKLLVSFDKHIGVAIGTKLLGKPFGTVLGSRLGLTLSVGAAAALSVPMSPFIISISSVGAIACGVALTALLLAKLNVSVFDDWQGNIQKPLTRQVFGKVTPT